MISHDIIAGPKLSFSFAGNNSSKVGVSIYHPKTDSNLIGPRAVLIEIINNVVRLHFYKGGKTDWNENTGLTDESGNMLTSNPSGKNMELLFTFLDDYRRDPQSAMPYMVLVIFEELGRIAMNHDLVDKISALY